MKLNKLADIFIVKYKFAENALELEGSLRKKINLLWDIPNKNFNILKICAEAGASKPQNANEQIAVAGFKFCQQLVSLIDYLKSHEYDVSLGEVREILLNIINLINENKSVKFNEKGRISEKGELSSVQFPHVSELIYQITPINKKNQIRFRNELSNKARTGLARIFSLAHTMYDEIKRLEIMVPEKFTHEPYTDIDINQENLKRFTPQRSLLSNYDIIDFIRQHGDQYGIPSTEDWDLAFRNDPILKSKMTTVINAINRGHSPRDAASIKEEVAKILEQHRKVI